MHEPNQQKKKNKIDVASILNIVYSAIFVRFEQKKQRKGTSVLFTKEERVIIFYT
jgi:hypothetical protein